MQNTSLTSFTSSSGMENRPDIRHIPLTTHPLSGGTERTKTMEKATMQPPAAKHAGVIEAMGSSSSGSDTEWYEVYLGTKEYEARKCKGKLWKDLSDYRQRKSDPVDEYRGKARKDYIAEVAKIVEGFETKGKQDPNYAELDGEKHQNDFSDSSSDGSGSRKV
ncbi:hypothetical protein H0H87_002703, partial [Tephrocybe sp. NHM501043]